MFAIQKLFDASTRLLLPTYHSNTNLIDFLLFSNINTMCVCMRMCMRTCIHMGMYTCMCTYVYLCVRMCVCVCMGLHMSVRVRYYCIIYLQYLSTTTPLHVHSPAIVSPTLAAVFALTASPEPRACPTRTEVAIPRPMAMLNGNASRLNITVWAPNEVLPMIPV